MAFQSAIHQLKVPEVVQLLRVPESTIKRWIRLGEIPCALKNGEYVFRRDTLLAWARSKHLYIEENREAVRSGEADLIRALRLGGVHTGLSSESREAFFESVGRRLHQELGLPEDLARHLDERERLSTTGIGRGVAVPHPRFPGSLQLSESLVATCYPEEPVDFGAPDGEAVFVAFVLLSADAAHHLRFLSQVAHLIRDDNLAPLLKLPPSQEQLLDHFQSVLAKKTG
ncbi:MAG: PTS sugar transporter subunit IIA [bacterium]